MKIRQPLPRLTAALWLLTLLAAAACSSPSDRFRLDGRLDGISQAEFFIYCDEGSAPFFDTITIRDGSFSYERPMAAPAVLTLLYPNFSQTYIVAGPGEKVRIRKAEQTARLIKLSRESFMITMRRKMKGN